MNKTILALILSLVCSIAVAQQPANEYYILRHESAFGKGTAYASRRSGQGSRHRQQAQERL